ncbi:hypothetical protein [Paenibacillus alginolyticus]|uniref:hypothetical protein n=1 Tax=Paenibacillus alginolyticus TaxID=59839 RepID=UPI001C25AC54|nr:hypothetical protein [Paenibacillus frigoriresistens]
MRGNRIKEIKIGNTIIKIDTSYVDTRTAEQAKVDEAMLTDAVWALYDEQQEKSCAPIANT